MATLSEPDVHVQQKHGALTPTHEGCESQLHAQCPPALSDCSNKTASSLCQPGPQLPKPRHSIKATEQSICLVSHCLVSAKAKAAFLFRPNASRESLTTLQISLAIYDACMWKDNSLLRRIRRVTRAVEAVCSVKTAGRLFHPRRSFCATRDSFKPLIGLRRPLTAAASCRAPS